jgi:hypothetical protein
MENGVKFFNKYKEFRDDFKTVFFHAGSEKFKAGWSVIDFTSHEI